MTRFDSRYLACEGREVHFTEWVPAAGVAPREPVIAWHGLARTGRDMDEVAGHLASLGHRVVCPDTIGRGLSQWSPSPEAEYCLAFYVRLAAALVDQLGWPRFGWLGTSMGGAIGLRGAATTLRGRITRLLLNDIGPRLAPPAVARIRAYAGQPPSFATMHELERYFRTIYEPYGWLSSGQWRRLAETSARRLPDGRLTPHYDPAMVGQFEHHPADYDQWDAWDTLDIPVRCLRGETSDLLEPEVAQAMRERGPRAEVIEVPGCGHAPALNVPQHFEWVGQFFDPATAVRNVNL